MSLPSQSGVRKPRAGALEKVGRRVGRKRAGALEKSGLARWKKQADALEESTWCGGKTFLLRKTAASVTLADPFYEFRPDRGGDRVVSVEGWGRPTLSHRIA